MQPAEVPRAVTAAMSVASTLGLAVDDGVVLNDSNRLVVRLMPCDVVARIAAAPPAYQAMLATEVEVAERLAVMGSPVAPLDPRVEPRSFEHDGFTVSMWTYYEPVPRTLPPTEYAEALQRLHAGLRQVDVAVPNFMDRVAGALADVESRAATPDLAPLDRVLLTDTLRDLSRSIVRRRAGEQLLHGEPHQWNVLDTVVGPLFTDFENACRGPVEYDLAWVPGEVSERHPSADQELVGQCRGMVLAIIAMHRWRVGDQHPSGRPGGVAFLDALRAGPPWPPLEAVTW